MPAALAGMVTAIGEVPNVALVIGVNPASALVPVLILYWVGVPVLAVYGTLKDVDEVNTVFTVPKVMVGTALTVPLTAMVCDVAPLEATVILPAVGLVLADAIRV